MKKPLPNGNYMPFLIYATLDKGKYLLHKSMYLRICTHLKSLCETTLQVIEMKWIFIIIRPSLFFKRRFDTKTASWNDLVTFKHEAFMPVNQHLGVFFNFVTKNHIPLHLIGETRDIILLHFKGLSNIGMEQLTLTINK